MSWGHAATHAMLFNFHKDEHSNTMDKRKSNERLKRKSTSLLSRDLFAGFSFFAHAIAVYCHFLPFLFFTDVVIMLGLCNIYKATGMNYFV